MEFNLNRIKAERVAKGMTIKEMAVNLDLTESGYSRIENGTRKLGMNMFIKICNVLDIQDSEVLIFFKN